MRELKRRIAKARMQAMGYPRINRLLSRKTDGGTLWRTMLEGNAGEKARLAQLQDGRRRKAAAAAKKSMKKRTIRRIEQ